MSEERLPYGNVCTAFLTFTGISGTTSSRKCEYIMLGMNGKFMRHCCPSQTARGTESLGWFPDIRRKYLSKLLGCPVSPTCRTFRIYACRSGRYCSRTFVLSVIGCFLAKMVTQAPLHERYVSAFAVN